MNPNTETTPHRGDRTPSILAACIGNIIEYYDAILFATFATVITPLFFPEADNTTQTLRAFATFGLSYVARPFGGLIFGYVGDKFGRKPALVSAIVTSTAATLIIGCCPTYASIGIVAPCILLFARVLQGISVGGEYSGAAIYVVENAPQEKRGLFSGLLTATGFFGVLLGSVLGFLLTYLELPQWSWRIPFLVGSSLGVWGFYMRLKMFEQLPTKSIYEQPTETPNLKMNLLAVFGFGSAATFYVSYVYLPSMLVGWSPQSLFAFKSYLLIYWVIGTVCAGLLHDIVGSDRVIKWAFKSGIFASILVAILLSIAETNTTVFISVFVMSIPDFLVGGSAPIGLSMLVPKHVRYKGVGFVYELGAAVFSGMLPLVSKVLILVFHSPFAIALYWVLGSLIGLFGYINAKKYKIN